MSTSDQERQRQTLLHFWNQGVRSAKELHTLTNIPLSTIYFNIEKIKNTGNILHKGGNGRPKKITADVAHLIGQTIRRDTSVSVRSLVNKVATKGIEVSHMTISRHLSNHGYKKSLPQATPMLTTVHKEKRVEWARKHLNDDWSQTLFTDETAFQLFRNTVERWHKGVKPVRHMPKDRTKILAWGGFCVNGRTSLFCFSQIMDANFYVDILRNHIPEVNEMLGDVWRFQQDNDPKHTSRIA